MAVGTDSAPSPAKSSAPSEAEKAEKEARQRWRDMRTASTELGAAGGIFVVDAAAPARNSLRMQAMTGFFVKKDYLYNDDKHRFGQSALSIAYVPYQHIELTAATSTRVSKTIAPIPPSSSRSATCTSVPRAAERSRPAWRSAAICSRAS